jgi:hypothetical protein
MRDLLTLTPNSTGSRLDIFDFSDFFDVRSDVPPEIKDLRTRGFGLWVALSSSEGIQEVKSCWVNFQTGVNEASLLSVIPLRMKNSSLPQGAEMN